MDITVTFPGGKRVDADVAGHHVRTDQSPAGGGEGAAPEPFHLFMASLATCAGIYVLGFCQARGIPTEGLSLVQHNTFDPETKRLTSVSLDVGLPADFPEKYRTAVLRAAENCKVKKTLEAPPAFEVRAV
jgi:ribosomal protein S12 methylthiotransferase accessory factor